MGTTEKIEHYINDWEKKCYSKGIPDEAPVELEKNLLAPSYRMICLAILKNDFNLKSLGYSGKKSKYYDAYKKIELINRGYNLQLKLNL
jgi:predicted phosphoadenosine phosphosulfate sulfurtransferase